MDSDSRQIGALLVTALSAGIAIWWLVVASQHLGDPPTVDTAGKVILDQWSRSLSVLAIVLPFFSATLAYWLGSKGTAEAKQDAKAAKENADAATQTAVSTRAELTAVRAAVSTSPDSDEIINKAKKAYPAAFTG